MGQLVGDQPPAMVGFGLILAVAKDYVLANRVRACAQCPSHVAGLAPLVKTNLAEVMAEPGFEVAAQ